MLNDNLSHSPFITNNNPNNRTDGVNAMIEQTARVLSTQSGYAWVMPEQGADCGACSNGKSSCGKSMQFFNFLHPSVEKLYAANPLHAKPGDIVVIGTQNTTLVWYSLLAYLLPLLSLLVFAILGDAIAQQMVLQTELAAILAGVAGLLSGLRLASWLAQRIVSSENAQPVILRHKKQGLYSISTLQPIKAITPH